MSAAMNTTTPDLAARAPTQQDRINEQKRILDARDGVTHRYSYLTGQLEAVA